MSAEHDAAVTARSAAVPAGAADEPAEADGQPNKEVEVELGDETEQAGVEQ